jgi:hypothetical protein
MESRLSPALTNVYLPFRLSILRDYMAFVRSGRNHSQEKFELDARQHR